MEKGKEKGGTVTLMSEYVYYHMTSILYQSSQLFVVFEIQCNIFFVASTGWPGGMVVSLRGVLR